MSRRSLIAFTARPGETGAADWRRVVMLCALHRDLKLEVTALCLLPDGEARAEWAARLRDVAAQAAFARIADAKDAITALDRRWGFGVIHCCQGCSCGDADRTGAAIFCETSDPHHCAAGVTRVTFAETAPAGEISAALLWSGLRFTRARLTGERILAGCWVEDDPRAIGAARAFFEAILRRGGGFAPNFALAGPGADAVGPPRLPYPVTVLDRDTPEKVFYRGVDIAVFPEVAAGASAGLPRYEAIEALELGATPLVTDPALIGVERAWRLPRFPSVAALAEFLLENGRALSEGGMMAELRARADWTWSGIADMAARQRAALSGDISARFAEREGTRR